MAVECIIPFAHFPKSISDCAHKWFSWAHGKHVRGHAKKQVRSQHTFLSPTFLDSLSLEDGTDRESRNVGFKSPYAA